MKQMGNVIGLVLGIAGAAVSIIRMMKKGAAANGTEPETIEMAASSDESDAENDEEA